MRKSGHLSADASLAIQQLLQSRTFTEASVIPLQERYGLSDRALLLTLIHATRQHLYSKDAKAYPLPHVTDKTTKPAPASQPAGLVDCPHCRARVKSQRLEQHVKKVHPHAGLTRFGKLLNQAIETKEEREAMRRQEGYIRSSSPVILKPYHN
jgi:hypothetical protein